MTLFGLNETDQRVDGGKRLAAHFFVLDLNAKFFFQADDQLEGVNGIQAQPSTKQRGIVHNFAGRDLQLQPPDDQAFDSFLEHFRHSLDGFLVGDSQVAHRDVHHRLTHRR